MKVLTLKIGDTVYTTGKITAYHSRRCLEVNQASLDIYQKGHLISEGDVDKASELLKTMNDLQTEKVDLICEIYGNKFTADVLEKNLTTDEISEQIQQITLGITGIIEKN